MSAGCIHAGVDKLRKTDSLSKEEKRDELIQAALGVARLW